MIKEDLLRTTPDPMTQSSTSGRTPHSELLARQIATQEITDRINNWIEEITCDLIGIFLFGPAFYFAYTYFLLSFSRLDNASKTHPPIRLRLKLMTQLLSERYPRTTLRPTIATAVVE